MIFRNNQDRYLSSEASFLTIIEIIYYHHSPKKPLHSSKYLMFDISFAKRLFIANYNLQIASIHLERVWIFFFLQFKWMFFYPTPGRNLFLMGNQPCEDDCAVFGMLAMLWMMPESSFVTKILKGLNFFIQSNRVEQSQIGV